MSVDKQLLEDHYTKGTRNGKENITTLQIDLSVVIPALHEGPNLAILIPQLQDLFLNQNINHEILIVTRNADNETIEIARRCKVTVLEQEGPGYGGALTTSFREAKGKYILTMDADL